MENGIQVNAPALDDIAREPSKAFRLSPETIVELLSRCGAAQGALLAAAASERFIGSAAVAQSQPITSRSGVGSQGPPPWSLSADEAAKRLGVKRRWLFRHCDRLPFCKRLSRKRLVCDETRLTQWIGAQH